MATTIHPGIPSDDSEHLRQLSIAHYIYGGLWLLLCLGILAFVGFMVIAGSADADFPRAATPLIVTIGLLVAALILAIPVLTILAGSFLTRRKNRVFCIVIAALNCLSAPFGTILGVLTIIVLVRPSVQAMFDRTNRI